MSQGVGKSYLVKMTESGETGCSLSEEPTQSNFGMVPQSPEDWKNYQHLKWAIRHGHIEIAKRLVREGVPVNVNSNISHGYHLLTPLHLAVQLGCLDLIMILLDKGASVCALDIFSETPLMLSVRLRNFVVTDLLLTADIIDDFYGSLASMNHLHIACLRKNISVVRKLISSGAPVNKGFDAKSLNWAGYTPLHFAVENHDINIVKLLLDNGADMMRKNAKSLTPLHLANEVRNEAIIDLLLSAHLFELGNPTDHFGLSHFHIACTRNDKTVVEFFLKQGVDVNFDVYSDERGKWSDYQPLMFAIYHECPDVVELLLSHGAYLSKHYNLDDEGHLGLAYEVGNQRIIDILLNSKAIKSRTISESGELSPLQSACIERDVEKIEKLIDRAQKDFAPELNTPLWNGCTPLHYLVRSFPRDMMRVLPYFEGSISIKDSRGQTPLHIFFENVHGRIGKFIPPHLLDFENNPSDSCGLTHLHIICTTNQVDLIEKFLKNGTEINRTVEGNSLKWSGFTPLHFAVQYRQPGTVDVLLKNGAKISTKNGNGLTPFDMAVMSLKNIYMMGSDDKKKWLIVWNMLLRNERPDDDFDRRGFSLLHVVCSTKIKLDSVELSHYVDILPGGINQPIDLITSRYHKCTPLHLAGESRNGDIADWLIKKGADMYLKDCRGFTPFQHELDWRGSSGILKSNPELLQVPGNPFDIRGVSYFHHACKLGDRKSVEFYLRSGVDINLRTRVSITGRSVSKTPLHSAISSRCENLVEHLRFLIDKGANVMACDAYLYTPLHLLNHLFNKEVAQLLLYCGADVNAQNILSETPLYQAYSNLNQLKFLIANGADINIENDRGDTILTHLVELLMNVGDAPDKILPALLKHVKKLTVIGFYVSDKNRDSYSTFFDHYELPNFQERELEERCLTEIQLMKSIKINQYTTVYDIIFKTSNDMTYLVQNASLRKLIVANDFSSKFPMYKYLIKLQCKRGLIRKPLLEKCKQFLHVQASFSTESAEKILGYLDDYDLRNLIASEKIIPRV